MYKGGLWGVKGVQGISLTVRVTVVAIESLGLGLGLSLSIGGPLAVEGGMCVAVGVMSVAVVRNISLGGSVKALGDGVQTCNNNNNNNYTLQL